MAMVAHADRPIFAVSISRLRSRARSSLSESERCRFGHQVCSLQADGRFGSFAHLKQETGHDELFGKHSKLYQQGPEHGDVV